MAHATRTASKRCEYMWDPTTHCRNSAVKGGDFCQQHCPPAQVEVYKAVAEHFRLNIREFWTRSSFFLVAHAALLSGFAVITTRDGEQDAAIGIILGTLGVAVAICWLVVAWISVRWIDRWRDRILSIEEVVDKYRCFDKAENVGGLRAQDVAKFLPLLFLIGWIALIVLACRSA